MIIQFRQVIIFTIARLRLLAAVKVTVDLSLSEMHRIAKELQLEVVDVISESKSAKAPGRIAFQGMLERIKLGEANGILCWKLNRLARNPIDGGEISWLLQRSIIKSIQCYGKEYRPEDNVLMMAVELGMANQYVNDLSVDVKRGMRKKAERGWYPSCQVPIGYRHNPKKELHSGEDEILTDDERLPLVKQIWQKMAEGQSTIQAMKRYADSIGLRTRSGNNYSYNAIANLLRNEFYEERNRIVAMIGSNLNIKDKTPYFSTPNALEVLEECKVVYGAKMKGFEPKKSLTPHAKNTHFEVGVSVLRRERDSNPRTLASLRFSRPVHSTSLPSLHSRLPYAIKKVHKNLVITDRL